MLLPEYLMPAGAGQNEMGCKVKGGVGCRGDSVAKAAEADC